MPKHQNTLNMQQRTQLVVWMNDSKEELETKAIPEIAKVAEEILGFTVGYHTIQRQRAALGWEKLTTQGQRVIKIHLDDFEHRLAALETKVKVLEDLAVAMRTLD